MYKIPFSKNQPLPDRSREIMMDIESNSPIEKKRVDFREKRKKKQRMAGRSPLRGLVKIHSAQRP